MTKNTKKITTKLALWRDKILDKPWKKYTVAGLLAIITMGALSGLYLAYDSNLRTRLFGDFANNQANGAGRAVDAASFRLASYQPENVFYKKRSLEDLPIYPEGWVKSYFTEEEQKNKAISGEKADPDQDGLSNKLELIYGSNPKKLDTLGAGVKDSEYVDKGINPLTGLTMDKQSYSYLLLESDEAALKSINESSDVLFNEGINLPKMYEEAVSSDYNTEVNLINLSVATNPNRNQVIAYFQQRANLMQDSFGINFTQDLASIYKSFDRVELEKTKSKVQGQLNALQKMVVPETELNNHKAVVYFNQTLIKIIDLRIANSNPDSKLDQAYQDQNIELVNRLVWAFRTLSVQVFNEGQQEK